MTPEQTPQPDPSVIAPLTNEAAASVEARPLPEHLVGGVAATGAEVSRPDVAGALQIGDLAPAAAEPYVDPADKLGRLGTSVDRPISTQAKQYQGLTLTPKPEGATTAKPETQSVPGLLGPGVGNTAITPWSKREAPQPAQSGETLEQQ